MTTLPKANISNAKQIPTPSSVEEITYLANDPALSPYLIGQFVNWYGHQVVPVVQLGDGSVALRVELSCPCCGERNPSYLVLGEETFSVLVTLEGRYLANLFDADERKQALLCPTCKQDRPKAVPGDAAVSAADPLRMFIVRHADDPARDTCCVLHVSALHRIFRSLTHVIAADDFERLALRKGMREYVVTKPTFSPFAQLYTSSITEPGATPCSASSNRSGC